MYVISGDEKTAMEMISMLREDYGVFVSGVSFPVVPRGVILFRMIPTASHTEEDVEKTLSAFRQMRPHEAGPFHKAFTRQPMTALVTGASRGIGRAIAARLRKAGYAVIGTLQDPPASVAVSRSGVRYLPLDLRDQRSIAALAEQVGTVDVLVDNAGMSQIGSRGRRAARPGAGNLRDQLLRSPRSHEAAAPGYARAARGG